MSHGIIGEAITNPGARRSDHRLAQADITVIPCSYYQWLIFTYSTWEILWNTRLKLLFCLVTNLGTVALVLRLESSPIKRLITVGIETIS